MSVARALKIGGYVYDVFHEGAIRKCRHRQPESGDDIIPDKRGNETSALMNKESRQLNRKRRRENCGSEKYRWHSCVIEHLAQDKLFMGQRLIFDMMTMTGKEKKID